MCDKKINIVIIGDSNTEGFGLADSRQSYPDKLNQTLGDSYRVYNMGASGSCVINTTLDGKVMGMPYVKLQKYKQALNINGDIFIINLGTNDGQDGMDDTLPKKDKYNDLISQKERFYADYMKIINDISAKYPTACIIVCIPIPVRDCIWRKHQQKYMDMLIPYIQKISKDYPDIQLIDLKSEFLKLEPSKIDSMYLDDRLHLNDKGTTFVSSITAPYIQKFNKVKYEKHY